MQTDLLKLPFEIQLVLAAGYLAYRISAAGLDRKHRTVDTVFQVLAYGLVAYVIHSQGEPWMPLWASMPLGIAGALAAAIIWRKWAWGWTRSLLRMSRTTHENFAPSTWEHIIHSGEIGAWRYIAVVLKDGYVFESDLDLVPETIPFSRLDVDAAGNVAIYVTHFSRPNNSEEDLGNSRMVNENGCPQITYIPKDEIARIDITYSPR